MTDEPKMILTPEEAESLLVDGAEYIHNYANPAGGMMFGVDYPRERAVKAFRNAHRIEIGGDGCRRMKHPLVVWDSPRHYTFFEADMAKVDALEAARAAP